MRKKLFTVCLMGVLSLAVSVNAFAENGDANPEAAEEYTDGETDTSELTEDQKDIVEAEAVEAEAEEVETDEADEAETDAANAGILEENSAVSGTCGENVQWSLSGDGVLTISGTGAIEDFEAWTAEKDSVQTLVVEDGVTGTIGGFAGFTKLERVELPEGISRIEDWAFSECTALKNMRIPSTVTELGAGAFQKCSALENIVLPDGLTTISYMLFNECRSLKEIRIPEGVTYINRWSFADCDALTEITIPEGVTATEDGVLQNCDSLKTVVLPSTLTSFGNHVFQGCTALAEINLPDDMTYVKNDLFRECTSLKQITLPKHMKQLQNGVFKGCTALESVTIYPDVTLIGDDVFDGCINLTDIYYKGTISSWKTVTDSGTYDPETQQMTYGPVKTGNAVLHCKRESIAKGKLTLAKTSYVYNGKARTPGVYVSLDGVKLKKDTDYTVKYSSNIKAGTAKVTVTGTGYYKGSLSAAFKIAPKGTSLSGVTAGKNSFTLEWKPQSVQTNGYQIQYSLKSDFSDSGKYMVRKPKAFKKKIGSLKKGRKYYVRIRTYKTVNGKNIYSAWSSAKTVKTR